MGGWIDESTVSELRAKLAQSSATIPRSIDETAKMLSDQMSLDRPVVERQLSAGVTTLRDALGTTPNGHGVWLVRD